ncbi:hypothetical protein, partial [Planomicrobium okeanokoites]|uniref:hypothetical protein n=1 Tax=Planomicrobium okeanokoites TaxID=244 RepID=UPI003568B92C
LVFFGHGQLFFGGDTRGFRLEFFFFLNLLRFGFFTSFDGFNLTFFLVPIVKTLAEAFEDKIFAMKQRSDTETGTRLCTSPINLVKALFIL